MQDNLKVKVHDYKEEEDTLSSSETFSGKIKRQTLRLNEFDTLSQYPQTSVPSNPWRRDNKDNCVCTIIIV